MAATPIPPPKRRPNKRRKPPTHHLTTTISTALSATTTFLLSSDLHLLPHHLLSLTSSLQKIQSLLSPTTTTATTFATTHGGAPACWFERFVLSSITDDDPRWVENFRMSKPTFSSLNAALCKSLSCILGDEISPHFALGCALYRLAHGGSFSFLGGMFGFSSNDACRSFYAVCKVVCAELGDYISGFSSNNGNMIAFGENFELPNCCGVLGMARFCVEGGVLGKDGFLMVQALVDGEGRFVDVSAGWPSTFTPEAVLRQTRLCLENEEWLGGAEVELCDGSLVGKYVLGGGCYPCLPWLVTPFSGERLEEREVEFNEVHKRGMGVVERAFRRVRANWKLLNRRWKEEFVEFLPFIITTGCVLNNFLMRHGEVLPDGDMVFGVEEEMPAYDGEVSESAVKNRNLLALHLSRVRQRM